MRKLTEQKTVHCGQFFVWVETAIIRGKVTQERW
nr:MAG TPA: 8-oxoguanine DNA glycosylase [Caudoviricetes sp.]DAT57997.1 MAG TPA: 8-oxoguanine DNA glycosylase [Caudoviricetes sp.]